MKKGEALQKCRRDRMMSQSQLAKAAGISLRTLQAFEQGQRDINKAEAETVMRLADVLEYHPKEIMNGYEDDYEITPPGWEMTAEEIIDQGLYDQAVAFMDEEIRERLHNKLSPCTELEFLEAYMAEHRKKYRTEFILP